MIVFITPDTTAVARLTRTRELGEDDYVHIRPNETEAADLWKLLQGDDEVDAVVIGPNIDLDPALPLIRDIDARIPLVSIIVFTDDTSSAIRAALHAGACDVVTPSTSDLELGDILGRAIGRGHQRRAAATPIVDDEPDAEIITVASPRGGVGRTLVAASLATLLERAAPGEVVLVDLHLQSGDVAPLLALTPELSIGSIAARGADFDSADLKTILTKTDGGLHVLSAPQSLTSSVEVGAETVATALTLLRESFRYVVVDNAPTISEETFAVLDAADHVLLVCAPDVPSVRALGRMADALDELQITGLQRHLVLNRATERYGMPVRDIEAVIGLPATAVIPAAKDIAMTLNLGESFADLVHPRSAIAKGLRPLLETIAPDHVAPARSGRSLLGRNR